MNRRLYKEKLSPQLEDNAAFQLHASPANGSPADLLGANLVSIHRLVPRVGVAYARRTLKGSGGLSKTGVVEDVGGISLKLELNAFPEDEGLTRGHIELREAGSIEAVPSHIAKGTVRRLGESRRIVPLIEATNTRT